MMTNNNGFVTYFNIIGIFSGKHINFSLIHSKWSNISFEEINDLKTALEHKNYQVEILKKEFTKYEEKAEEQIDNLKNENAKLKYRIQILLKTIDELEKRDKRIEELEDSIRIMNAKVEFFDEGIKWLRGASDEELERSIKLLRSVPYDVLLP